MSELLAVDTGTRKRGWQRDDKELELGEPVLSDEVMQRHRMVLIFADWAEASRLDEREALSEEVVRMIVPSLTRFVQKQKDRDFSKILGKYSDFKLSCVYDWYITLR